MVQRVDYVTFANSPLMFLVIGTSGKYCGYMTNIRPPLPANGACNYDSIAES